MRTSHSNPSSEAGSVSSQGNSPQISQGPGHQYKKSLSNKADPNTALHESHDPSTFTPSDSKSQWMMLTSAVSQVGSVSSFSLRSMQHTDREGRLISMFQYLQYTESY